MLLRSALLLALPLGVVAAGCGSQASSPPVTSNDGSMLYSCATETRAPAYMVPGMTEMSTTGAYVVTLMSSDPKPPSSSTTTRYPVKGTNSWTIQIADGGGNAIDGLTIGVLPYMPDHAHGTTVEAVVTDTGGGVYGITPLYLYMEGFWTVTLSLQPASGASDSVVFPVCIP